MKDNLQLHISNLANLSQLFPQDCQSSLNKELENFNEKIDKFNDERERIDDLVKEMTGKVIKIMKKTMSYF